ncbi:MAG: pyridoxal-phosphate dependent enzyme [Pseudomonadota bacterium]
MLIENPWRRRGLPDETGLAAGSIETDPTAAQALYALCPAAGGTPLIAAPALGDELGLGGLYIKDERGRMGLGSFKALGAAHAIAKRAAATAARTGGPVETALTGETFICASAGNHGLSLAAAARIFGAQAVIHIAETVPDGFARRLSAKGALVEKAGKDYEAAMALAKSSAAERGWHLLSDSTWEGYVDPARDVMEGYLIMGDEAAAQMPRPPTHIFLQAGVGGLAAACAAAARRAWGDAPRIIVVEPDAAPALLAAVEAGRFVTAPGPVSNMGRLDCKEASHLALKYLATEADAFMTVSDEAASAAADRLATLGLASTPSGVAGFAGLLAARGTLGLDAEAHVLLYLSEGAEDA